MGERAVQSAEALERELERVRASHRTVRAQAAILHQIVTIHDRLSGLVLQGADVAAITGRLSELIGRRVLLLDMMLKPVVPSEGVDAAQSALTSWNPSDAYVQQVVRTLADDRRPLRVPSLVGFGVGFACVVAPIVVGEDLLGYLMIPESGVNERGDGAGGGGGGELNVLVVQHAATVYALAMMRERMAAEVNRQLRNELLDGLLLGHLSDPADVVQRAVRVGIVPGQPYQVLVLAPEDRAGPLSDPVADARRAAVRRRRLLDGLTEFVERKVPEAIATMRQDGLVVIMPVFNDRRRDARALGRAAINNASTLFSSWALTVGIGGPCADPTMLAAGFAQAQRAAEAAQRFGRVGEVVAFEDLGLYRLLFQVTNSSELDLFVDQVLGKLIAYDSKHQAGLILTLDAFLRNNASPQATARDLAVHVNTVSYRLQRMRTVGGLNLDLAEDRLLAGVALKIVSGMGPLSAAAPGASAKSALPPRQP